MAISQFLDMASTKGVVFEAPSHIVEHVYFGNEGSAIDRDYLVNNHFAGIIVAGRFLQGLFPDDFTYLVLDMKDIEEQD